MLMENISRIGRIFYGLALAEIGIQAIYCRDFPYMLFPSNHLVVPGLAILAVIGGVLFILAGASIIFEKKVRQVSLLSAGVLLLIFCFHYIPYEFIVSGNYMHLAEWENAEKELALAGGALAIAGCFPIKNEGPLYASLGKLIPLGAVFFSITMVSFGILHFMYTKDASTLVPSWIPGAIPWTLFCGAALIGSGIAIILKIKVELFAALLGLMIFLWVIMLHAPRVIVAPAAERADEISSVFIALAYSGIALVISGAAKTSKALL